METRKATGAVDGGWIIFILIGGDVIQIHSNGEYFLGRDDRMDLNELVVDAKKNRLHSQSRGGVRWGD